MSEPHLGRASQSARHNQILSGLGAVFQELTGLDSSAVDVEATFFDLGADSLLLIQASQAIQNRFDVKISFRVMMEEAPTLDSLAAYLDNLLPPDEGAESSTNIPPQEPLHEESINHQWGSHLDESISASGEPATNGQRDVSVSETVTERIMAQQLQAMLELMSKQLDLLRQEDGTESLSPTSPQILSARSQDDGVPQISTVATVSSTPAKTGHDKQPRSRAVEAESFAPFQPIKKAISGGLTSRQQKHLEELIGRVNERTRESKRHTQAYRYPLADSSTSAGFRLLWKEMLYPLVVERSSGSRIWDLDGNEYMDVTMGFGSLLFGHSPSFVLDSIQEQIHKGIGLGLQADLAGKVAQLICELTGMERATFCNSGTEAVMTALRVARTVTNRNKIVMFAGSYHGTFDGTLGRAMNVAGNFRTIPAAPGVPPRMMEDVIVLDYGNPESLNIIKEHGPELAAVLVEPVQSRRPDLQPKAFLQDLRELTQQAGIALIFDEVITGFRTHLGGVQALFDIRADLVIYGKAVGAGMPIGVVAGKAAYMNSIDGGMWGYGDASYPRADMTLFAGTYFKHPFVMASAWAALNYLKHNSPQLQQRLNEQTARLVESLNNYFEEDNLPMRVKNFGSLFRISFPPEMPLLELLYYHLLEKGIHVGETRNCFLSTAHTDEDIDFLIQAVKESIAELRAGGFLADAVIGSQDREQPADRHFEKAPAHLSSPHSDTIIESAHLDAAAQMASGKIETTIKVPLTEAQRQLWVMAQMGDDASSAYNESMILDIRSPLNLPAMRKAVQQVVNRHEALRTTFSPEGDDQIISSTASVDVPLIDFSHRNDADRQSQVAQWLASEARRPFNLVDGPLLRTSLIKLEQDHHLLVINFHHIVVDGWSFRVMLGELLALYRSENLDVPCHLPQPMQYSEYARWQASLQESGQMQEAEQYWLREFADSVPVLDLPTDRRRRTAQTFAGLRQHTAIDTILYRNLKNLSAQHGCTLFVTLLAGFAVLLHRLTDQEDVVVGIPAAGQLNAGSECLVGYCVNLLPLHSKVSGRLRFTDYLAQLKKMVLDGYEHQIYPLIKLVKRLNIARDSSRPPVVAATFNLDRNDSGLGSSDLQIDLVANPTNSAKFDISLNITESKAELHVDCDYNIDLFEAETIQRWMNFYQTLLANIAENPRCLISEMQLMNEQEQKQLLSDWNRTHEAYPQTSNLVASFQALVQHRPDTVALVQEGHALSYGQLNGRANQLARYLKAGGLTSQEPVGICMRRSLAMVEAILAVLKAGAAYLPLDETYPQQRLAQMLKEAGVQVVVTQAEQRELVEGEGRAVVDVEGERQAISLHSEADLQEPIEPESLAYVIYTSGSTGTPKGVMITHRGIFNTIQWRQKTFSISDSDNILHSIPFVFDPSVWQLFGALLSGARLVITRPETQQDIPYLIESISQQQITMTDFPPSLLKLLLDEPGLKRFPHLRCVFSGAEALQVETRNRFFERLDADLYNQYGPTEAAIDTTYWNCRHEVNRETIPIGRPIANKQVYIQDSNLQPVPIGVPGELYVGGIGLARGYINRPELSAESFIPDRFSNKPGARLYKTGDLVRYMPDGNIEFLGRTDHQVKIRGFRIELEEIETTLLQHPLIQEAVVGVLENPPSESRLVAYVVTSDPSALSVNEMRRFLKVGLPEYMVPAIFVTLETMPLLPNGKVDRRALPAPLHGALDLEGSYTAPHNTIEKVLTEIWSKILRLEQVGIHNNFFELGGDSILGIQIVARANQAGIKISARQLFQFQTIAELAAVAEFASPSLAPQLPVSGPLPLTPIQSWFFELDSPDPHHWNQALLLSLPPHLDPLCLHLAFAHLLLHHDALRLRFAFLDDLWHQQIAPPDDQLPFSFIDLSAVAQAQQSPLIERLCAAAQASLQLTTGPLLRAVLFSLGQAAPPRLLIVIHHLAVDGVSWRILLEDLHRLYEQLRAAQPLALPAKTTSVKQWAELLSDYARGEALQAEADYWLAGAQTLTPPLPLDHPQGRRQNSEGSTASVTVKLSRQATQSLLKQVPAAYHTQINEVLLAALAEALRQWSGAAAVRLDVEGHGREEIAEGIDLTRTVGWLTAVYPLVIDLQGAGGMVEVIKRVKETVRGVPKRGLGYGLLRYMRGEEEIARRLGEGQQAEISFNYLGQFDQLFDASPFQPAIESSGPVRSQRSSRPHLIDFNGLIGGGRLQVTWTYSENLHQRATIEHLANRFIELLQSFIAHCQAADAGGYALSDFPLAGLDQKQLDLLLTEDRPVADIYPLSPMQQGLLFHCLYATKPGVYVNQLSCRLEGNLDVAAFKQAWEHIVDRHAILHTAFVWEGLKEPLQMVCERVELPWHEVDWRAKSAAEQQEQFEEFLQADRDKGFDLHNAPLMRLALMRVADEVYHFTMSNHHLILDGWSLPLVFKEVFMMYAALMRGHDLRLPASTPFRDYIAWLKLQDLSQAASFWKLALKGFTAPTPLNLQRQQAAASSSPGSYLQIGLSPTATADLQRMCKLHQLTINTVVQGAWGLLLWRYSGQADVVFGATVSGRAAEISGIEQMVGLLINTLPVRLKIEPGAAVAGWLQKLQGAQAEMRQYEYSPLVEVQGWSDVPRGLPLFESLLVFENYPIDESLRTQREDIQISLINAIEQTNYPITLMAGLNHNLSLRIIYDQERIEEEAIRQMLGHLKTLLEAIAADPQQPLSAIRLMNAQEQKQLLSDWNRTHEAYPQTSNLVASFEALVQHRPDAIALVQEGQAVSYGQLNSRANQLARYLKAGSLTSHAPVGICMRRSVAMVEAILAVLKAGAAYLPIDATYPKQRIEYVLKDAGVRVVVTQAEQRELVEGEGRVVVEVDGDREEIAMHSEADLQEPIEPESLAYVIYTSGSTGAPKGVGGLHRACLNRFHWMWQAFPFDKDDICCQKTSLSFVDSVWEIFGPLLKGVPLVIIPDQVVKDPNRFIRTLADEQISRIVLVPSLLRLILDSFDDLRTPLRRLRYCISSGEALSAELSERFREKLPDCVFLNLYGSSEVAADATFYNVSKNDPVERIPIGRPISNSQIYLLDSDMQPVATGLPGEIYVGGANLARGYFNHPDMTAERFIPDSFSQQAGARLYKTGDLGRYRLDGNIEYLGRRDHQVKLRGFRIELGEIEAALRQHESVQEAIVSASNDLRDETRLVGYVATGKQQSLTVDELREFLRTTLPEHMVPSAFVLLDRLPLTPSGKVDRLALPKINEARAVGGDRFVPPGDMLELELAQIWEEVLDTGPISVTDNFFDLGGHSILAVRLMGQIERAFGHDLALSTLLQATTVAQMASILRQRNVSQKWSPLVKLQPLGSRKPVFFVHPAGGNVLCYIDLARRIGPDQPAYGLQSPELVDGQEPYASLEEMSAAYIEAIRLVQPEGPYRLGGWSFGGLVAFEIAQQLRKQGEQVESLVLFDTSAPSCNGREEIDDAKLLAGLANTNNLPISEDYLRQLDPVAQLQYVMEQAKQTKRLFAGVELPQLQRLLRIFKSNVQAGWRYAPQIYDGKITLFRASTASPEIDRIESGDDLTLGWSNLSGEPVEVHTVPGNHYTIISDPHAEALAKELQESLRN